MNTDTYQFVLALSGSVIMLLLISISFFLRMQISATKTLTESVNVLNTSVEVLRNNQDNINHSCTDRHKTLDRRVDRYGATIVDHEKRIIKLER